MGFRIGDWRRGPDCTEVWKQKCFVPSCCGMTPGDRRHRRHPLGQPKRRSPVPRGHGADMIALDG